MRLTGPAQNIPLTVTVDPAECEPFVVLTSSSTPILSNLSVESGLRQIDILQANDPSLVNDYQVTIDAKIETIQKHQDTFTLTIYDCSSLTIDASKFLTLPYIVGEAVASRTWEWTDITREPLCGDVTWTATNGDDSPLDDPLFEEQVNTSPYSVSV